MAASKRVAGVIDLVCTTATGGTFRLALRGKWKVVPTETKKEGIAGQDRVHGYKEMPVVPYMEGDITYEARLLLRDLDRATGITAQTTFANGRNWIGYDGWRADVSTIDTEEGSIGVKFEFIRIDPLD